MPTLDTPNNSGPKFRQYAGPEDCPGMAAVREGSRQRDRIDICSPREAIPTAEELASDLASVEPGTRDVLIVEIEGQIVGYDHVLWRWTEEDGAWVGLHLGYLLPEWRGRGIGQAMVRWAQGRLREIARAEAAGNRAVFATNVSTTESQADALIRAEGYSEVKRLSDMTLDDLSALPEAELPAGLSLRLPQPEHYLPIYAAYRDAWGGSPSAAIESTADYQAFLDENVRTSRFDPTLWQVAWDGNTVAGIVTAILQSRGTVGEIPEVAIRRSWKRRGLGRALMIGELRALRDRGVSQVRIITNAANLHGAKTLYESLGFREVKQHVLFRKRIMTIEAEGTSDHSLNRVTHTSPM